MHSAVTRKIPVMLILIHVPLVCLHVESVLVLIYDSHLQSGSAEKSIVPEALVVNIAAKHLTLIWYELIFIADDSAHLLPLKILAHCFTSLVF